MTDDELRTRWAALSSEERRFVRAVAALGEPAGTHAGNELVAAYAARRLARFRLAAQAMVAAVWMGYLVLASTLLRDTSATTLAVAAVLGAAVQAAWVLRAEDRLRHAIAANRSA